MWRFVVITQDATRAQCGPPTSGVTRDHMCMQSQAPLTRWVTSASSQDFQGVRCTGLKPLGGGRPVGPETTRLQPPGAPAVRLGCLLCAVLSCGLVDTWPWGLEKWPVQWRHWILNCTNFHLNGHLRLTLLCWTVWSKCAFVMCKAAKLHLASSSLKNLFLLPGILCTSKRSPWTQRRPKGLCP